MKKIAFFMICLLNSVFALGANPRGGSLAADITCTFSNPNLVIALPNFKAGSMIGASPLKDIIITIDGKSVIKKSISAPALGLGSAVEEDTKDHRPAAFLDFEDNLTQRRLVIYYCSGSANTVDSKLFTGRRKANSADFKSSSVLLGTCTANNIVDVFTSDCSSFLKNDL